MFGSKLLISFMSQKVLDSLPSKMNILISIKFDNNFFFLDIQSIPDIDKFLKEWISFHFPAIDIEVHIRH